MHSDLPTEIWIQIVCCLPRWALYSLSLVSHTHCSVTRPRLFRTLTYTLASNGIADAESGTQLQHELQRLEVWASDRIAPHVRTFSVALYSSKRTDTPFWSALRTAIRAFVNLRTLRWTGGARTVADFAFLGLDALPHLEEVSLSGGRVTGNPERKLRIARFSWVDMVLAQPGDVHPLALIDADTLTELRFSSYSHPLPLQRTLPHGSQAAFSSLRRLSLETRRCEARELYTMIRGFPALSTLVVQVIEASPSPSDPSNDVALASRVAMLELYRGPVELLPYLAPPARVELLPTNAKTIRALVARCGPHLTSTVALSLAAINVRENLLGPGYPALGAILEAHTSLRDLTIELSVDWVDIDASIPATEAMSTLRCQIASRIARLLSTCSSLETVKIRWHRSLPALFVASEKIESAEGFPRSLEGRVSSIKRSFVPV